MKKIGITQRMMEETAYAEVREGLDILWAKWFQDAGLLPILLPSSYDFQQYIHEVPLDGVILSGGNDLNDIQPRAIHRIRDSFEERVIHTCIEKSIPLAGICRGMQMIGHVFGLSLHKINSHIAVNHRVQVQEGGHLSACTALPELTVNSFHQYGFTSCGNDWIVEAVSEDGVIEAFSHKKYKIYGQMWHPERPQPSDDEVQHILISFFDRKLY